MTASRGFYPAVLAASFMAAFLSFSIQPMAGKAILPLIGGAPQGWLVALAFFQSTLTAGYALVFFTRRVPASVAVACIAAVLGLTGFFFSPVMPAGVQDNGLGLFIFLWRWLGLPLVALGTMAPLVQRLFFAQGGANPYRLYAVSNAGSLLGLLAYPFLIEPLSGLHMQTEAWRWAVMGLAVIALLAALRGGKAQAVTAEDAGSAAPSYLRILQWIGLAMIPASLLSGSTLLISTDAGSFPMLWVVPLALYLGTYIMAFRDNAGAVPRLLSIYGTACALLVAVVMTRLSLNQLLPGWLFAMIILGMFTLTAFLCHARLYAWRPDARHLPLFYLTIAAGGALGGGFNAFVAPVLFSTPVEFYLVLALSMAVLTPAVTLGRSLLCLAIGGGIAAIALLVFMPIYSHLPLLSYFSGIVVVMGVLVSFAHPKWFGLVAMVCLLLRAQPTPHEIYGVRNFFGVLRVSDTNNGQARILVHGVTMHGSQPYDDTWRYVPAAYYSMEGAMGDVLKAHPAGRVAIVGLGAGQTACYATPVRQLDYYEIDPDVLNIAQTYFGFLDHCPPANVIIGDARLSLAQSTQDYDVIVLDAFSSDAIPAHLLTREAVEVYRKRLKPDGVILFHISNRYLALDGPLGATARDAGLWSLMTYSVKKNSPYDYQSVWLAMGQTQDTVPMLEAKGWFPPAPSARGWSDDYAPLLSAIRMRGAFDGTPEPAPSEAKTGKE